MRKDNLIIALILGLLFGATWLFLDTMADIFGGWLFFMFDAVLGTLFLTPVVLVGFITLLIIYEPLKNLIDQFNKEGFL